MNIRNAEYKNSEKTIVDVEIDHPEYGWIPYGFRANEPDDSFDKEIREWLKSNTPSEYVVDFDTEKQDKLNQVSEKFLEMFKSGTFVSASLGFEVDNRRYGAKFDRDNVESLIEQLSDMPDGTTIQFKGVDGFHELNLSQLETLKKEMIADGLSKHQWKWAKENEINSIVVDENTTAEQAIELLEAIDI